MSLITKASRGEQIIADATLKVQSNLHFKSYTSLTLANDLGLSVRQLNRNVKKASGKSVGAFMREVKLNLAKQLLEQGVYETVEDLSNAIGFKKASHFSKIYENKFGKRPAEISNIQNDDNVEVFIPHIDPKCQSI
ncbi:MAG: AraC family transcriptional regulator [Cyclobacteriaceae bacterium]